MVNDIDTNDYNNILNNTYIVLKKDIENIMPNINRTLKVRNNPNDEYVYVFRLEVDGILDIVSPLTLKDIADCGKTFTQFEKDYKPRLWNPIKIK